MEQYVIETWNHKDKNKYYTLLWGPYPSSEKQNMIDHFKKMFGPTIMLLSYKISEKIQN